MTDIITIQVYRPEADPDARQLQVSRNGLLLFHLEAPDSETADEFMVSIIGAIGRRVDECRS